MHRQDTHISGIRLVLGSPCADDPNGGPWHSPIHQQPQPRRWVAADSFGPLEMALDGCQVVCKILKCLKQYSLYNVIKSWGG